MLSPPQACFSTFLVVWDVVWDVVWELVWRSPPPPPPGTEIHCKEGRGSLRRRGRTSSSLSSHAMLSAVAFSGPLCCFSLQLRNRAEKATRARGARLVCYSISSLPASPLTAGSGQAATPERTTESHRAHSCSVKGYRAKGRAPALQEASPSGSLRFFHAASESPAPLCNESLYRGEGGDSSKRAPK